MIFPVRYGLFFFNYTATTEIYTLSLHDALPISARPLLSGYDAGAFEANIPITGSVSDRKSTRLNSSNITISYAVFCLKKKTKFITLSNPKKNLTYQSISNKDKHKQH